MSKPAHTRILQATFDAAVAAGPLPIGLRLDVQISPGIMVQYVVGNDGVPALETQGQGQATDTYVYDVIGHAGPRTITAAEVLATDGTFGISCETTAAAATLTLEAGMADETEIRIDNMTDINSVFVGVAGQAEPIDGAPTGIELDTASGVVIKRTGGSWIIASEHAPDVAAAPAQIYDVPIFYMGTPLANEVLAPVILVRDTVFAANFGGSAGAVTVNPFAVYVIDVQDDGVSIGTISISTAGVVTFTTVGGTAKTVAAGSVLTFVGQAVPDTLLKTIYMTLKASV